MGKTAEAAGALAMVALLVVAKAMGTVAATVVVAVAWARAVERLVLAAATQVALLVEGVLVVATVDAVASSMLHNPGSSRTLHTFLAMTLGASRTIPGMAEAAMEDMVAAVELMGGGSLVVVARAKEAVVRAKEEVAKVVAGMETEVVEQVMVVAVTAAVGAGTAMVVVATVVAAAVAATALTVAERECSRRCSPCSLRSFRI